MLDLTPLQRSILRDLSMKSSYELYASRINGEWIFSEGGTRVEADIIKPMADAGLIVGEKQPNGDVVYTVTDRGRRFWAS